MGSHQAGIVVLEQRTATCEPPIDDGQKFLFEHVELDERNAPHSCVVACSKVADLSVNVPCTKEEEEDC